MISATEKATLRANMERYEGKVTHMYLDSKGFVTVGVGHLIKDLTSAQKLNFKKSNNMPASKDEIKADYDAVKKQRGFKPELHQSLSC
jgi:GH24 family phage-related lysozyme (muramidase)